MKVVLLNASSGVSAADAAAIAAALTVQVARDLAPAWLPGQGTIPVVPGAVSDLAKGDAVLVLSYLRPEPADLGWHSTFLGFPFGFAQVPSCIGTLVGPESVCAVSSHEMCELLANPSGREVQPGPQGTVDREICDPVAGSTYVIGGCSVSNFVLPSYFLDGGAAPFDLLNVVGRPFAPARGGYQVGPDGTVTQGARIPIGSRAARLIAHRRTA